MKSITIAALASGVNSPLDFASTWLSSLAVKARPPFGVSWTPDNAHQISSVGCPGRRGGVKGLKFLAISPPPIVVH